jgi:hypothetical protein
MGKCFPNTILDTKYKEIGNYDPSTEHVRQVHSYSLISNARTCVLIYASTENISKILNSPLLSSQPVLESIFHRGVAVCEGDSDRVVYQTFAVKQYQDEKILFILQTLSKIWV